MIDDTQNSAFNHLKCSVWWVITQNLTSSCGSCRCEIRSTRTKSTCDKRNWTTPADYKLNPLIWQNASRAPWIYVCCEWVQNLRFSLHKIFQFRIVLKWHGFVCFLWPMPWEWDGWNWILMMWTVLCWQTSTFFFSCNSDHLHVTNFFWWLFWNYSHYLSAFLFFGHVFSYFRLCFTWK